MALRDYMEPTDTQHASETVFMDRLLEGWGKWAHDDGVDLRPTAAGDLWQIQAIIEVGTYVLKVTDEQFLQVDQGIARLPGRLRGAIFIEYRSPGVSEEKARHLGLTRLGYRQRLHAAQWALFTALMPEVDNWRQQIYVPGA